MNRELEVDGLAEVVGDSANLRIVRLGLEVANCIVIGTVTLLGLSCGFPGGESFLGRNRVGNRKRAYGFASVSP